MTEKKNVVLEIAIGVLTAKRTHCYEMSNTGFMKPPKQFSLQWQVTTKSLLLASLRNSSTDAGSALSATL
jgi:hypothetical protein